MKKIKLIAMDCDGTLLNSEKHLTEYTRKVLEKAIKQGVVVLAATGRPDSGLPKEVLKIEGIKYAITSNGGRILDLKNNEILLSKTLEQKEGTRLLKILAKYDTYKEVFFDGIGYGEKEKLDVIEEYVMDQSMGPYLLNTRKPVEDLFDFIEKRNEPMDKIQAIFRKTEDREQAGEEISELIGREAIGALENNIEINADGVNKAAAVLYLAEFLGIAREEVMTFGDAMNDIEMIQEAGIGVAMGNAVQKVKDAAYYITDTNDNNGVAKAIEKFVLS